MIRFLLGKPSSGPRMTSTSSAAWLYCRMHGGTIPVRTHLRGPRTSLCFLDDPVTFPINEDHAPKIRSCKDRPLCGAGESGEGTFGFEYFVRHPDRVILIHAERPQDSDLAQIGLHPIALLSKRA